MPTQEMLKRFICQFDTIGGGTVSSATHICHGFSWIATLENKNKNSRTGTIDASVKFLSLLYPAELMLYRREYKLSHCTLLPEVKSIMFFL